MALKVGIVGLPNVGKSTLFKAITNSPVEIANYPFATIEPNIGIVELPDKRLEGLASIVKPNKIIPATFEFIDIAGLVAGASKGEGLGNKFLANIREVDAIVQVVRCFDDDNIIHVSNSINPIDDIEIINLELILADLETVSNVFQRISRKVANDKKLLIESNLLHKIKTALENGTLLRQLTFDENEQAIIKNYHLLTIKPVLYVGNVNETYLKDQSISQYFAKLSEYAQTHNTFALSICAKVEQELSELDADDRVLFLQDLGIDEPGLNKLIRESFKLLNLATFFTAGVQEVKAWTFVNKMLAPSCAGLIHSDFERGFIRVEVIKYEDFMANNGWTIAKTNGKVYVEGKNYQMQDGDIVNFRFNV